MIIYYLSQSGKNPVFEFLNLLEKSQKAKVFRIFEAIEKYGISSIPNHLKKMTGIPLWEIRILGKDNIRVIYIIPHKNVVLILNAFFKKQNKTPVKEIEVAL